MTHFSDGVRVGRFFGNNGTASQPGVFMSAINVFDIAPIALSATAIAAAQAVAAAGNLIINGTQAVNGVVTLLAARCLSIVSTNIADTTQTATIFGTDFYGLPQTETITFNGTTTVNGRKAFLSITRVSVSAALAGNASVGTADIFGLPFRVANRNYAITGWNGAIVTTGTFTAADATSPATSTTGDVRGTFAVPDAANGTKRLTVWIFIPDEDTSVSLYGVTPA